MSQPRPLVRTVLALAGILGIAQFQPKAHTGDTARIYGSVRDSSGATVANAGVIAQNQNTGVDRKTVSTESGDFVTANLPTGTYTVKILQWLPIPTNSTGLVQVPVYLLYSDNQFVAKVDHTLSDTTRVTARYPYDKMLSGNGFLPTDLLGASGSPDCA